MVKFLCALLALGSSIFCVAGGANILGIFNYPSKSHHILGQALMKGLARRGHNVTMVSPFGVAEVTPNYTHIEINEILKYKEEKLQDVFQGHVSFLKMMSVRSAFQQFTPILLGSRQMQELLHSNSTFDVMIMLIGISDSPLALANHFKVPVIGFAPVGGIAAVDNLMGNPSPYSYVPNALSPFNDDMNFKQRLLNTVFGLMMTIWQKLDYRVLNKYFAEYFPGSPSIEELAENISLVLVNSHVSTETPRPYLSNIIQIGGFHIQEPEALPEDLQRFLDGASESGVVYLSFGTNLKMSHFSPQILAAFVETFKRTSLKVLWNYDGGTLDTPSNVRLEKWLPQRGILAHRNVKVFITHGGMGSVAEALYYGVPLVCVPFFGDQEKNCGDVVRYGIGRLLKIEDLTTDLLHQTLNEILSDSRYKTNAEFRSQLLKEQPIKPMDHAIFWVEHVIKHKGAKHLRARATKLAWYQLLLLDVVAFLGVVLLVFITVIYYLVKVTLRKLSGRFSKKVKTQ